MTLQIIIIILYIICTKLNIIHFSFGGNGLSDDEWYGISGLFLELVWREIGPKSLYSLKKLDFQGFDLKHSIRDAIFIIIKKI
jgi:hypothetical protein